MKLEVEVLVGRLKLTGSSDTSDKDPVSFHSLLNTSPPPPQHQPKVEPRTTPTTTVKMSAKIEKIIVRLQEKYFSPNPILCHSLSAHLPILTPHQNNGRRILRSPTTNPRCSSALHKTRKLARSFEYPLQQRLLPPKGRARRIRRRLGVVSDRGLQASGAEAGC